MDIFTHTLSGVATGTVAATFSHDSRIKRLLLVFICTVGGFFPDIDAISLWSQFDITFGKLFALTQTGKEIYGGTLWYSHHAFFHSLFGACTFTMLLALCLYIYKQLFHWKRPQWRQSHSILLPVTGFFFAYLIHLVEDMVTPASVWGGVALMWPSSTYYGGTGSIWWWNNYDITLIICAVIIINTLLLLFMRSYVAQGFSVIVAIIAVALITIQVTSRTFDFSYSGNATKYQHYENESKKIQQVILGEKLYSIMRTIDRIIPFYF